MKTVAVTQPEGRAHLRAAEELSATLFDQTRIEGPEVTRARLRPCLKRYGITRVANVTGLDRIGIPVFMAIRPNSRSLSVSQGKSVTEDAAWVSGVMESIELWHAEAPDVLLRMGPQREVRLRGRVMNIDRISRRRGSPFSLDHRILWTQALDLLTDEPTYVPYALVHVNAVPPFPPGDECFFVTSNGLASGSVKPEAIVHALCEVVERDAVTRWRSAPAETRAARWIDATTVDEPILVELLELCELAQFDVLACDADSPVGLPVIVCVLLDRRQSSDTLRGAAMGFGCHLRRDLAFLRALTEAAQSRLTLIAGSRDDLDRSDYESRRRHRDGIEEYRRLLAAPHPLDFRFVPDYRDVRYEDQVDVLLERLSATGIDQVAVVDLSRTVSDLVVVRVIVPGMLGPDHVH